MYVYDTPTLHTVEMFLPIIKCNCYALFVYVVILLQLQLPQDALKTIDKILEIGLYFLLHNKSEYDVLFSLHNYYVHKHYFFYN